VVPAADRARILAALAAVDAVVQFDEETPAQVLAMLRPHLYVKGGDYGIGDISECDAVEAGGGHVVLLPYVDGRSTSGLMDNVIRRHAGSGLMG
jgi:bifunctional ADP-heptose synthase (sugar kinase/adenylyltransferase)